MPKIYLNMVWADTAQFKWSFQGYPDNPKCWLREWIDGVNWGSSFQVSASDAKSRWNNGQIIGTKSLMWWSLWISEWLGIPRDQINPAYIQDCPGVPEGMEQISCDDPNVTYTDICEKCYKATIPPAIKETIGWEAIVPAGEHTFHMISVYGAGTTEADILANAVAVSSIQTATPSMSRQDIVDTSCEGIPAGTYSCVTFIAESFDGSNISGVYDSKVDIDVLIIS